MTSIHPHSKTSQSYYAELCAPVGSWKPNAWTASNIAVYVHSERPHWPQWKVRSTARKMAVYARRWTPTPTPEPDAAYRKLQRERGRISAGISTAKACTRYHAILDYRAGHSVAQTMAAVQVLALDCPRGQA